ncbi:MAG: SAM-dependent methyltransferase [Gammaproteobacteria bacterium]|nr:SAM-dependent methyltransferase [Gammaproteobacteria bacterium]
MQWESVIVDSLATTTGDSKKIVVNLNKKKLSPDCTKGLIECFSHVYFIYLLPGKNIVNVTTAKLVKIDGYRITVTNTLLPDGAEILDIKPYSTYFLPDIKKIFSPIQT